MKSILKESSSIYRKRLLRLYLMAGIILLAFGQKATAQTGCLPDCPQDLFGPTQYITMEICPGVFVDVRYSSRIACNTWYDYYIEDVPSHIPGSCIDALGGISGVLEKITEMLIIANPAGFPPLMPNDCEPNWRVMKGSCWQPDVLVPVPITPPPPGQSMSNTPSIDLLTPCTVIDCCLEMFMVCLDQNGDRIVTCTGYLPPLDPECLDDLPFNPNTFWKCYPVCGSIYNR